MSPIVFLAAVSNAADLPPDAIVVTGARLPVEAEAAPVSVSVLEEETIEALALPATADLLRLLPSVSVATSGPRGSQTQLRIRGAEANHTLLFVDGIRFNDPAAGNEARFELLTADALSRIELVRGPQSALWGSEAIGGVVSLHTADARRGAGLSALAEYGSLDTARASAQGAVQAGDVGLSASAGWQRSDGIDSFAGGGERDGFENRSASAKAVFAPVPALELGLVGHWMEGESEFDGYDPATFARADTLDATDNRIAAGRAWALWRQDGWRLSADLSHLDSANRNRVGAAPLNRTAGARTTASGQIARTLGGHSLIAAAEHQAEDFKARDQVYFGGTDQDRARSLTALVGEWRAQWTDAFSTDLAVRHDSFSAFADATTLRATVVLAPAPQWRLHAAYGEGVAQPTFYDLYGFFPGSFAGNPELKPERSRGWEAGVRWTGGALSLGATAFAHRLTDEIVDTFDPVTFTASTANASGTSRRKGLELDGSWRASEAIVLGVNYTFLDAEQRQVAGSALVREVRRPRHSANVWAAGEAGRLSWGAAASFVGSRRDTDFDSFPAVPVVLDDYVLASLKVGWRLTPALEAFARAGNAFDAGYQDAFGYRTPAAALVAPQCVHLHAGAGLFRHRRRAVCLRRVVRRHPPPD
ncbi:MAG: TonB-dependent receptor plug domain-containing protein, partial [Allosphingosinicella sp.]